MVQNKGSEQGGILSKAVKEVDADAGVVDGGAARGAGFRF